jgi:hypothetical protein
VATWHRIRAASADKQLPSSLVLRLHSGHVVAKVGKIVVMARELVTATAREIVVIKPLPNCWVISPASRRVDGDPEPKGVKIFANPIVAKFVDGGQSGFILISEPSDTGKPSIFPVMVDAPGGGDGREKIVFHTAEEPNILVLG